MTPDEVGLAQQLFEVFELLKTTDKFPDSSTAKILRERDATFFRARAEEEWSELRGVIEGTHSHTDFHSDFLLESSQVFYWLCLAAIGEGKSFEVFLADLFYVGELKKLETLFKQFKIPFSEMLEKDLRECREKGYL